MQRLTGPREDPSRAGLGRDRGGAAVILAVILGSGLLIGFGAVVIDVGRLLVEREELQSGADSAAEAVARQCVTGTCTTDPVALATTRAGQNARDGAATAVVCGSGITGISACSTLPVGGELVACLGKAPAARYVEVHTSTRNKDGITMLPPDLARGLAGKSTYQGTKVGACARVGITPGGTVTGGNIINLAIDVCVWNQFTGGGATYSTTEQAIVIKDSPASGNANRCNGGDQTSPGNWGWLDDLAPTGDCKGTIAGGDLVKADTGNNTPGGCESLLSAARTSGSALLLPLFDTIVNCKDPSKKPSGSNTCYHIAGMGAFVVTGWWLTSTQAASVKSGMHLCGNPKRCVYGYFTTTAFTDGVTAVGSGTGFGATSKPTIKLIG